MTTEAAKWPEPSSCHLTDNPIMFAALVCVMRASLTVSVVMNLKCLSFCWELYFERIVAVIFILHKHLDHVVCTLRFEFSQTLSFKRWMWSRAAIIECWLCAYVCNRIVARVEFEGGVFFSVSLPLCSCCHYLVGFCVAKLPNLSTTRTSMLRVATLRVLQ